MPLEVIIPKKQPLQVIIPGQETSAVEPVNDSLQVIIPRPKSADNILLSEIAKVNREGNSQQDSFIDNALLE
ncbi:unnamed protein product, partial [marine sediment metagenome]